MMKRELVVAKPPTPVLESSVRAISVAPLDNVCEVSLVACDKYPWGTRETRLLSPAAIRAAVSQRASN